MKTCAHTYSVAYPAFGWQPKKDTADATMAEQLGHLENHFLSRGDFIAGASLTVADISIVTCIKFLDSCPEIKVSEKVKAWIARCVAACPAIGDVWNGEGGFGLVAFQAMTAAKAAEAKTA